MNDATDAVREVTGNQQTKQKEWWVQPSVCSALLMLKSQ